MKSIVLTVVLVSLLTLSAERTHCQDAAEIIVDADTLMQLSAADSTALDSIKTLITQGQYAEAESKARELLARLEAAHGTEPLEAADVIEQLVVSLWQGGRAGEPEALALAERAVAIHETLLGTDHPKVASSVNNMAIVQYLRGHFEEAERLFKRGLTIRESAFGPDHPDVAKSLGNLAAVYLVQQKLSQAEPIYKRVLMIQEKALGPDHPNLASALNNLALVYDNQGRYAEAEQIHRRALAIWEKALGPEHPDVAVSLSNLALLCELQGKYAEAERGHKRALAIQEKALGSEHPNVAQSMHNLANVYHWQARYVDAQELWERALAIREKALGPEHPDIAKNLNALATVYSEQGRLAEAESFYGRVLAIQEKTFGPEHPDVALSLNNLGLLYSDQGRLIEAEELHQRAIAIREAFLEPGHPDMAISLNNLANVYYLQGKYAEAESLHKEALSIRESTIGSGHPITASSLSNLARVYDKQGKDAEAESLYVRSLDVFEEAMGMDHPSAATYLQFFSTHYRLAADNMKALDLAGRAVEIRKKNFCDHASAMSERDALTYSQFLRGAASGFLSAYSDLKNADGRADKSAADVILFTKGSVMDGMFERQKALVEETDSTSLALSESLRATKFLLSNLFVQGPGEDTKGYRSQIDSLSKLANEQEADLARHSASFRKQQDYRNVSIERVASLLPKQMILVEYVQYDYLKLYPDSTIPHYLATILDYAGEPAIVKLGRASDIDALIGKYRKHMLSISSAGGQPSVVDAGNYRPISHALYDRIWKPVAEYLTDKDLVLIAADGGLNMLSFAGLMDDDDRYLIENHSIHHLSSGRDLIRLQDRPAPATGLFALGDPDYDATVLARLPESETAPDTAEPVLYAGIRGVRSGCGTLNEILVSPLPGTRREVEQIMASWQESQSEPLATCFGPDASEENVKAAAPGHRVIHLATHGYFLQGECQSQVPARHLDFETDYVGENPLLLSGLFLAGANLHGEGCDEAHAEDGILTAYEVSELDLDGTDLVVLSACETGLGEVKEGEGVYGLRRAFQMAGARTVISALWPVSDEATAELLGGLYSGEAESLADAMRAMQLERISELREGNQPDHPFIWGGFLAIGDWK